MMVFKKVYKENGKGYKIMDPLEFQSINDHVLIVGSSGSGKSFFGKKLFPNPEGLILFKPDPLFDSDTNVIKVREKGLPDPFTFEFYDVADSYLYALDLDLSGIMASSLVSILFKAFPNSNKNLHKFFGELEKIKKEKDFIVSSDASLIYAHFALLYGVFKRAVGRPSKYGPKFLHYYAAAGKNFKISFAGTGNFKSEFGSQLLLRSYYSSLNKNMGSLMIDEFHHVSRAGSIVDTLLREFRVSGRLIGITQNLTDVLPSMLNNFGYIFVSRDTNGSDLDYLSKLDPGLPEIVSRLPPYVFLSLYEYLNNKLDNPYYRWFDD